MFHGAALLLIRALREDTRLLRFHIGRAVFVLWMIGVLVHMYYVSLSKGAPGLELFRLLMALDWGLIWLAGISYFASPVTEEKELSILGLLKLAGVSPLGLLLGKSTSRLITALMYLTLQLPLAVLAVTLGGVTLHQILAGYASLVGTLFLTANLGLLMSVISPRTRDAAFRMIVMLLLLDLFPILVEGVFHLLSPGGGYYQQQGIVGQFLLRTGESLQSLCSYVRLQCTVQTGFSEPLISEQVCAGLFFSVLCFLLAWALFERCTRDDGQIGPRRELMLDLFSSRSGEGVSRPCWNNGFVWKDFVFMAGGVWGNVFVILIACSVLLCVFLTDLGIHGRLTVSREAWLEMGCGLSAFILFAKMTLFAGRFLSEESRWHTLSTLCLTPHSRSKILYAKLRGGLLSCLPLLGLCGICYGLLLATNPRGWPVTDWIEWRSGLGILCAILYLLIFLHLVVSCSLLVRWGIPSALALMFVCTLCLYPVFPDLSRDSGSGLSSICLLLFIINLLLHITIDAQVERLARME